MKLGVSPFDFNACLWVKYETDYVPEIGCYWLYMGVSQYCYSLYITLFDGLHIY